MPYIWQARPPMCYDKDDNDTNAMLCQLDNDTRKGIITAIFVLLLVGQLWVIYRSRWPVKLGQVVGETRSSSILLVGKT